MRGSIWICQLKNYQIFWKNLKIWLKWGKLLKNGITLKFYALRYWIMRQALMTYKFIFKLEIFKLTPVQSIVHKHNSNWRVLNQTLPKGLLFYSTWPQHKVTIYNILNETNITNEKALWKERVIQEKYWRYD